MNGRRAVLGAIVVILTVLLISSALTDAVYAHHKSGHSGGGGNSNSNSGGNSNSNSGGNSNGNSKNSFDSNAYNKQTKEDRIQKNTEQENKLKENQINKLKELGNPEKTKQLQIKHDTNLKLFNEKYEKQKAQLLREQLKEINLTKEPELIQKLLEKHQKELEKFEESSEKQIKGLEKKLLNEKIRLLSNEFKEKLRDIKKQFRTDQNFQEILRQLDQEFKEYLRFLKQNGGDSQELIQKLEEHTKEMKKELEVEKEKELIRIKESGFVKIDPSLISFLESDNPIEAAKKLGIDFKDDEIKLVVKLVKFDPKTLEELKALGAIDAQSDNYVQLTIKIGDVSDLKNISGISGIRLPSYLSDYNPELKIKIDPELKDTIRDKENIIQSENDRNGRIELEEIPSIREKYTSQAKSEGVYFINADRVHSAGITGENVKVAVLDIAFDSTNPKIIENIVETKSFVSKFSGSILQQSIDDDNKIAHGTAVAEIIIDVAPDSELFLYEMDSDVEFAAAVDEAISKDVDVIAMSASWPNFPTDGTSHITKKVEDAISNGITFVVPSGNFANKHWEGSFADDNGNGWNEFSVYDEGITFSVTKERIEQQKPIMIELLWNIGNGDVIDLDFALIDPSGDIISYSALKQKTKQDEPRERIFHIPTSEGLYSIGVLHSSFTSMKKINMEIFSINDELEHAISKGSVTVPGDAEGVIVVGAVNSQNGDLESFSSQGPTNDGRLAPHVVGPDGVTTLAYNGDLFYGTSATTPYVAGIAALLLDAEPNITNENIMNKILQNTKPSEYDFLSEYDNYIGYGLADASFIVGELLHE